MKLKLKVISCLLLFIACSDDETVPTTDCTKIACTAQFVIIDVRVQDPDGVNIPLDDFEVTDKITGDDLTASFTPAELEQFRQNGAYPLYDDRFVLGYQNQKRGIVFKGEINGEIVVNNTFVVQADCCHVSLVSDNALIILI